MSVPGRGPRSPAGTREEALFPPAKPSSTQELTHDRREREETGAAARPPDLHGPGTPGPVFPAQATPGQGPPSSSTPGDQEVPRHSDPTDGECLDLRGCPTCRS